MTCLNPDRDQLFRLAAADASIPSPRSVSAPHTASLALPSGLVLNIEAQPNNDVLSCMIASRCKRMTFRSNENRKRYLTVHRLLSQAYSGDA